MPDCRLLGAEPCIERLPLPKRPPRHLRVDRVRPIPASENARMIAGAGARMRHAVRLDDRHARAGLTQMMRGPGAENTRTDNDNVTTVHGSRFGVRGSNRERHSSVDPYRTILTDAHASRGPGGAH